MEGVVCKRADSAYQQSRSPSWLKVKCLKQQEFVIGGYSKPEGSRVGFGALLLGYYEKGALVYAGRVGTGFTTQSLRDLTAPLKKLRIDATPFKNPPTGSQRRGVTWVKPELVAEVEFTEWTSDGRLRHPSFQGLREDKRPEECTREVPERPGRPAGEKTVRRPVAAKHARAAAVEITPTHAERVVFPRAKLTKGDVFAYYRDVAGPMVRALAP